MCPARSVLAPVARARTSAMRRGLHAGRPHHGPGGDPLGLLSDPDRHAACVDVGDHRALADGDAEVAELLARLGGGRFAERGDHALAGVEQDHPGGARVDPPEVASHRVARQDRELPRDLHSGRPAADDDEGEPLVPGGGVVRPLGLLEGAEDPVAEVNRVAERLQAARHLAPLVVTEVGRLSAAGDDQAVVLAAARRGRARPHGHRR